MAIAAGAAATATTAIVASSYLSLTAVAITVCVVCVLAAVGWPHLLQVPARKSQAAAIGASAVLAVVLTATTDGAAPFGWFPAMVALGVGAVFMIQLVRGTGQSHRLESILGAGTGVLVVAMGSGWVAADRLGFNLSDSGMTLVTGVSVLVAIAVCLLPLPDRIVAPVAVVLAALAGPLGGLLLTEVPAVAAAVIGAVCGAVIAATRRLAGGRAAPLSRIAAISVGVSPVLGLGAVVYLLDRLLLV
ncbi:hypothetical protein AC792_03590 [Arthrobacter sp. RIT-PI-e]|uniref:hypothetical protein n=1 Tax=Arthrobacter sp. RIT-PI-e TaxID=1681197 RepID=UPI0006A0D16F|nr:hypothetical protein [Arthrobacter sp. RIT-PI-e]KNC19958.1 hypothetical protein AC792_03590 [Arthrobacter sp. RIT-PI-e]